MKSDTYLNSVLQAVLPEFTFENCNLIVEWMYEHNVKLAHAFHNEFENQASFKKNSITENDTTQNKEEENG